MMKKVKKSVTPVVKGPPYYFTFEPSIRAGAMVASKLPSLVPSLVLGTKVYPIERTPSKEAVRV